MAKTDESSKKDNREYSKDCSNPNIARIVWVTVKGFNFSLCLHILPLVHSENQRNLIWNRSQFVLGNHSM